MGRKCSVFGCNSGYLNDPYDGSVFSFPPEGSPGRKMWVQSVKFSVSISPSFTVTCFVNKTKIPVAHLIDSFSHKLEKRSQLQNVIFHVREATPDAIQELRGIANDLKMFTETL